MPDIKIKRYADKENLKKLVKYSKDTFANKNEINEKFYTKEQIDTMLGEVSGGIGDNYYTKSEIDTKLTSKANKTTTLSGYGITDAYTKTQVDKKVSDLVNSAPETLDTLNELASALGDDPNFATTVATQIGKKANSSDVYNKSETDTLLLNKANTSGTYSNLTVGNAGSATNATYANWLRTSSHTDYLFHTEWDGSYFCNYVVDPAGGHAAVKVARSESSGNADTATKLATARTIALSGAATGTATAFDGSGNITIPVTALSPSAIRAQWYAAYPDGAEAHNAMWGGRDITDSFNNGTVSRRIADGTFRDIFPGDYITKQVTIPRVLADDGTTELFAGGTYIVNWVVTDCDYWINKGEQDHGMTTHHVAIVPQRPIFNTRMNATNTTEGGYAGSEMYKKIIPACATGIVSAFGSEHIMTFRDHLTRDLNTSVVSSGITVFTGAPNWNGAWYSQQCNLMSEAMVYDGPHCASSALDNTMATRQMSAFRLSEKLINYNRQWWWLRDIVSSTLFAFVYGGGGANASYASIANIGVRPFALLR